VGDLCGVSCEYLAQKKNEKKIPSLYFPFTLSKKKKKNRSGTQLSEYYYIILLMLNVDLIGMT
jgi:hypothetical protein